MEPIQKLAAYIQDDVPDTVVCGAKQRILDNLGAAVGAASEQEIQNIENAFSQWFSRMDAYSGEVWCSGSRTNLFAALLINGLMSHTLEMDDVHTKSKCHIGAVVVTTAWTICEALGKSGRELLEAVIVGYEVMARIGYGMDVASNRKRGWHCTGLIGVFGSCAVCSRLLGLNTDQTASALGIAGGQAAGLWAFLEDGATTKKLSPARAIVNGFTAAVLAQGGMLGPVHILDAKDGGLYRAVSDSFNMDVLTETLGTDYEILKVDSKPYPCCRTTHHAIDAALKLRNEISHLEQIEHILVETYDVGVLQCGFEKYPETVVEAKFSIPYTAALALYFGRVSQDEFSELHFANPVIAALTKKIRVTDDSLFTHRYPARWGSRMTVSMKDGSTHVCQIDDISGSVALPMSDQQLEAKFLGLTQGMLGKEQAKKVLSDIWNLDRVPRVQNLFKSGQCY